MSINKTIEISECIAKVVPDIKDKEKKVFKCEDGIVVVPPKGKEIREDGHKLYKVKFKKMKSQKYPDKAYGFIIKYAPVHDFIVHEESELVDEGGELVEYKHIIKECKYCGFKEISTTKEVVNNLVFKVNDKYYIVDNDYTVDDLRDPDNVVGGNATPSLELLDLGSFFVPTNLVSQEVLNAIKQDNIDMDTIRSKVLVDLIARGFTFSVVVGDEERCGWDTCIEVRHGNEIGLLHIDPISSEIWFEGKLGVLGLLLVRNVQLA